MVRENEKDFADDKVKKAKAKLDALFYEMVEVGYGTIEINFAKANDLIEVIPSPKFRF